MTQKQIFNFEETGILKLDKVIFESYYPILFTCKNESNGKLYLCVCSQADSKQKKWLVKEVSPHTMVELLNDKMTIRNAFLVDQGAKYTVIYDMNQQTKNIEEDNKEDWNEEESIDLPTTGEYLDAEDGEFEEEISYFEDLKLFLMDENVIEPTISFSVGTLLEESVSKSLYRSESFINSYNGNILISSDLESTRDICSQDTINWNLVA